VEAAFIPIEFEPAARIGAGRRILPCARPSAVGRHGYREGSGWSETVTVVVELVLPPGPVAVRVKVIVWDGASGILPERDAGPIPGVMVALVALDVLQLREVYDPVVTVEGVAVK